MTCIKENVEGPLTLARLKELLIYNSKTGVFVWRKTKGAAKKGRIAGCGKTRDGYIRIRLDGYLYLAHRLAWFYHYGEWPEIELDHKNHVTWDNAIKNLRDGTRSLNLENQIKAQKGCASGKLGAYLDKRNNRWYSRIAVNKVDHILGYFPNSQAAHEAYLKAKRKLHKFNLL